MSNEAHIIDIDSVWLIGVDLRNPGRLSAPIEAEVRRALEGMGFRMLMGLASNETRVAGEMARTVVRSIHGGSDGV